MQSQAHWLDLPRRLRGWRGSSLVRRLHISTPDRDGASLGARKWVGGPQTSLMDIGRVIVESAATTAGPRRSCYRSRAPQVGQVKAAEQRNCRMNRMATTWHMLWSGSLEIGGSTRMSGKSPTKQCIGVRTRSLGG